MNHQWILNSFLVFEDRIAIYYYEYYSHCIICKLERYIYHYNFEFIVAYGINDLWRRDIQIYKSCNEISILNVLN